MIYLFRRIFFPNSIKTMEWLMLRLLNKDRRKHGLKPLFMQSDLRDVARLHSKDMAKKDYFEHENLLGQSHADRYKLEGITDVVSGENLAKISGFKLPVHRAEIGLMNSPGHRANILNSNYNCVGIGVHKSEKGVFYFTQNFAKRSLIFSKNFPRSVRKSKGLSLKYKPVHRLHFGMVRVLKGADVVKEKGFRIEKGVNRLNISFPAAGHFEVQIYSGSGERLQLVNQFQIHVRSGWFG